jgi:hypothetical protein
MTNSAEQATMMTIGAGDDARRNSHEQATTARSTLPGTPSLVQTPATAAGAVGYHSPPNRRQFRTY